MVRFDDPGGIARGLISPVTSIFNPPEMDRAPRGKSAAQEAADEKKAEAEARRKRLAAAQQRQGASKARLAGGGSVSELQTSRSKLGSGV